MAGTLNQPAPRRAPRGDDPVGIDRWAKAVLLVGSLVTLAFLVAAMVRENFLGSWRYHQRQYRAMLLDSKDEHQRRLGDELAVEIRQVDLPQFDTTDRCVSCHVGIDNPAMAAADQPYRTHPGDYLEHHPVAKYGCTICHRGQGAATDFREAKATDVHWDYPLLPSRMTQASCGTCHAPDSPLMAEHAPLLARGRRLFLDRGCQGCHKLDGVGGQLGPALDGIGHKVKQQLPMAHIDGERTLVAWLQQHFEDPQGIVAGSKMRPPRLTPAENDALTAYMLSLQTLDLPQTYSPADRIVAEAAEVQHKEMDAATLYHRLCATCHGEGTLASWDKFFGRFMPAIRAPGLRGVADEAYLRTAISEGRPGTLMPAWSESAGGLTDAQIDRLVTYLDEGDERPPLAGAKLPTLRDGDSDRGQQLFTQLCSGCHGANGLAPNLANAVFQASADDAFLARTIRQGRPDAVMPAFQRDGAAGLTDQELRDVVAFVRSLGPPTAAARPDAERAASNDTNTPAR